MIVQIYVKTLPVNFNGAGMLWAKCLKRTDSSVRGGECGASWLFTGVAIFIVYVHHMKRVEGRMGQQTL